MRKRLLHLHRPFNCGVVFLTDGSSRDQTTKLPTGSPPAVITPSGAVIVVRHAQDVDDVDDEEPAAVTIEVIFGAATQQPSIAGSIDIPSGDLLIGDAERREVVSIAHGRYTMEVLAIPIDSAEQITIWLSPRT